ncbi:MAG: cysteine desulfurase family protein [Candidatus Omnitrophota bacterium]
MKTPVYLDHNATTPLHPEVKNTLTRAMDIYGNPSSFHSLGRQARQEIEQARETIASFIGAETDELFFVGSGSEANNTVFSISPCEQNRCVCNLKMNRKVITTSIEHPCILESAQCLRRKGSDVIYLDVDEYGKVKSDQLESHLNNDDIGMVSIMTANNEIGTIQDIKGLAKMAHAKKALFHTDAVQAVGKIPLDVKDLDVDFLTISAHKIYGPKGIGALYVRKGIPFCPLIVGGHQERGRRAGTENTLGIIGFGKAIEMRRQEMDAEHQRLLELKTYLKDSLEKMIPDIRFNGHPRDCLTSTLNVSFDGVEGESLLLYLDAEDIAVSTGSACASGSLDPSHVLLATGLIAEQAHGSIRVSLGRDSTKEEMDYFLNKLQPIVKRLRSMSTAYKGGAS